MPYNLKCQEELKILIHLGIINQHPIEDIENTLKSLQGFQKLSSEQVKLLTTDNNMLEYCWKLIGSPNGLEMMLTYSGDSLKACQEAVLTAIAKTKEELKKASYVKSFELKIKNEQNIAREIKEYLNNLPPKNPDINKIGVGLLNNYEANFLQGVEKICEIIKLSINEYSNELRNSLYERKLQDKYAPLSVKIVLLFAGQNKLSDTEEEILINFIKDRKSPEKRNSIVCQIRKTLTTLKLGKYDRHSGNHNFTFDPAVFDYLQTIKSFQQ